MQCQQVTSAPSRKQLGVHNTCALHFGGQRTARVQTLAGPLLRCGSKGRYYCVKIGLRSSKLLWPNNAQAALAHCKRRLIWSELGPFPKGRLGNKEDTRHWTPRGRGRKCKQQQEHVKGSSDPLSSSRRISPQNGRQAQGVGRQESSCSGLAAPSPVVRPRCVQLGRPGSGYNLQTCGDAAIRTNVFVNRCSSWNYCRKIKHIQ